MASHPPSEIDPEQLKHAQGLWQNFGVATKWGIILVILVLVGLAVLTL